MNFDKFHPIDSNALLIGRKKDTVMQPFLTLETNSFTGDVHDTFKVDVEGNIFDAHTTSRVTGGKEIRLDWAMPYAERRPERQRTLLEFGATPSPLIRSPSTIPGISFLHETQTALFSWSTGHQF